MIEISQKQDIALQIKYEVGYIEYSQSKIINAEWAYYYALNIIKNPWPLGESVIASDHIWAYCYALNVIEDPWPLGESSIASHSKWAYYYSLSVIKGPWPPGEKAIFSNIIWKKQYQEFLKNI